MTIQIYWTEDGSRTWPEVNNHFTGRKHGPYIVSDRVKVTESTGESSKHHDTLVSAAAGGSRQSRLQRHARDDRLRRRNPWRTDPKARRIRGAKGGTLSFGRAFGQTGAVAAAQGAPEDWRNRVSITAGSLGAALVVGYSSCWQFPGLQGRGGPPCRT